jgi:predicted Fe-S protein YdhL (DUF1289 family)
VFECFSPPCGRIKGEIIAWIYRMKGEGRDAIVVDAKPRHNDPKLSHDDERDVDSTGGVR